MATVLIVEDEPDILFTLRVLLELDRHVVLSAATGAEALAAIDAARPDVMLLDLGLPDMSGWDILERLRQSGVFPALPVLVFSAYAAHELAERALAEGCRGYLVKPFAGDELRTAVTGMLAS